MDWDTARVDEHKILQKVTSEELEEIFHKPVCFPRQHPLFRRLAVKSAGIVLSSLSVKIGRTGNRLKERLQLPGSSM